jgi:hypothetical protein
MRRSLLLTTGLVALTLSAYPVLAQETQRNGAGSAGQPAAQSRGAQENGTAERRDADQRPPALKKADEQSAPERGRDPSQNAAPAAASEAPEGSGHKGRDVRGASGDAGAADENGAGNRTPKPKANAPSSADERQGTSRKADPAEIRKKDAPGTTDRNADAKGEGDRPTAGTERSQAGTRDRESNGTGGQKAGRRDDSQRTEENGTGRQHHGAETERGGARAQGRLKIDESRASSVRDRLVHRHDAEIRDRSIRFALGVAIPAAVHLAVLPDEIVSEYPEFRGYDYVTEDDEVAIIDPHSREVVEVIASGGGREARGDAMGEGDGPRGRYRFTRDQNALIRRSVSVESSGGERPMLRVPSSVELRPLPRDLAASLHAQADLGYFIDRENRIVVADPDTREVVDIVE